MELLDAALAFALTMAALATVVTILMEIGLRFLGLRRKDQVTLVKRLYDDHLAESVGLTSGDAVKRWEVARQVLENPLAGVKMAASEQDQGFASGQGAAIYDKISVEHLLRRVVEVDEIKAAFAKTEDELRDRLTALAQKYDEYRSAMAARFKSQAQAWSLALGIALALALNVDGLRLFEFYVDNSDRSAAVIERQDAILANVEAAEARLAAARAEALGEGALKDLDAAVTELTEQGRTIDELELPIGRKFFPYCLVLSKPEDRKASADALCRSEGYNESESIAWLVKVLLTGLLIGLGAPFWYDVAKRLAKVRSAFGGGGSALDRHSGNDSSGAEAEAREDLIDRIVKLVMKSRSRGSAQA